MTAVGRSFDGVAAFGSGALPAHNLAHEVRVGGHRATSALRRRPAREVRLRRSMREPQNRERRCLRQQIAARNQFGRRGRQWRLGEKLAYHAMMRGSQLAPIAMACAAIGVIVTGVVMVMTGVIVFAREMRRARRMAAAGVVVVQRRCDGIGEQVADQNQPGR